MKQVAEAAGVHVSTVSRALNPDKRGRDFAKMKSLMDELGPIKASLDQAVKDGETRNLTAR